MTETKVPAVSVVMPSYNHAPYIGRAVESVLGQACSDLELIVVDNNSSDGTDAVLAGFADPRLRVVKFSNGGIIAASRNKGLELSSGEYVAFIDSDDVWLPGKIQRQLEALRTTPAAAFSYSRFRVLTGEAVSGEPMPAAALCGSGDLFGRIYSRQFIACSGVMARKAALAAAGGFDEAPELFAVEDTDLWLRLAGKAPVVLAGTEPLFLYRVHPGASSGGYWKKYRRALGLLGRHRARAGLALYAKAAALLTLSVVKNSALGALKS